MKVAIPEQGKNAEVRWKGVDLIVSALSGHRALRIDYDVPPAFVSIESSDEILGRAVLDTLAQSRVVPIQEVDEFFNRAVTGPMYEKRVKDLMAHFGSRNKSQLFKGMRLCHVNMDSTKIRISPNERKRADHWQGLGVDQDIQILVSATVSEVGAAVRLGLDRCR
jgi:CDI immunity protein